MPDVRLKGPAGRSVLAPVVLVVLTLLLAAATACGCARGTTGGRLKVVASIVPLADFVREVGGELVEVRVLIPPGASAHTFDPTAGEFAFLEEARLMVTNGLELEGWVSTVIERVGNKDLERVAAGEAVPESMLIRSGDSGGTDHAEGPYDPHVWLDPRLAIFQVDAIASALAGVDPANRSTYLSRAERYKREVRALDRDIEAATGAFGRKEFVALHPAWAYFARRYGLTQVAAIEELPGKEPSGRETAAIVDEIRAKGIPVVFAEPQISPKAAEVIARESGARLLFVDPLGNPDSPGVGTYVEMMRHNTEVMGEGLR